MEESFFKKLSEDILKLEINTIIKSNMAAIKMPNSRRHALYMLANEYSAKLEEYGVRDPVYWQYAGMRSFGELRDRAKEGIEKLNGKLGTLSTDERQNIREKISMLERIQYQSSQIVGIFKILEQRCKDKTLKNLPGYAKPPESLIKTDLKMDGIQPAAPHLESKLWNNDIDGETMNEIDDLDLTPDLVIMIRKAWEVGTENIIMQTVIQLDGDITTRISENLAKTPNPTILRIHNDSIETSTRFWSNLIRTLGEMAVKMSGLGR